MTDGLTPDQARLSVLSQDAGALVATLLSEKADLRVRVLQLEAALEQSQSEVQTLRAQQSQAPAPPAPTAHFVTDSPPDVQGEVLSFDDEPDPEKD